MTRTLYLLPNLLDTTQSIANLLPEALKQLVPQLNGLFAESEKGGRAFLKHFSVNIREVQILEINEHTTKDRYLECLSSMQEGSSWGYVSDAGLSCIGDPGEELVALAYRQKIHVVAYPGPSSIFMALMLAGINADKFTYHGYLPRESLERQKELKRLEKEAIQTKYTHIFIETPYRNQALYKDMEKVLAPSTYIVIALDLTSDTQQILRGTLQELRKQNIEELLQNRPAVFLLAAKEAQP